MHCATASAERRPDRLDVIELVGLEGLGDVPDQPAGQDLGDVRLDQLRVGRHQLGGEIGQQVVDPAVAAERLDHRVQPAELLAEPRLQGRRGPAAQAGGADRAGPSRDSLASDGMRSVAVTSTTERGPQAEEPTAPDLARRQDHGVAAEVPPHPREGLLHRPGPVGSRRIRRFLVFFVSEMAHRTTGLDDGG